MNPNDPRSSDEDSDLTAAHISATELELILSLRALQAEGDYLVRGLTAVVQSMPRTPTRAASIQNGLALVETGALTAGQVQRANEEIAQGALAKLQASAWLADAWGTISLQTLSTFLHRPMTDLTAAIGHGEILALEIGGEQRIPTWQLSRRPIGQTLPHLSELLPVLLGQHEPLHIGRFFATRQQGLYGEGFKTPAAWLEDGGDPNAIREIIEHGPRFG